MACQIVLSRNAPSGWHLAPHSDVCTAWVNFHQPQYRFTERQCYSFLAFFPSNIELAKIFQFFVPFCFHASLGFCTHTHTHTHTYTHFLLTTRYLTVTKGKFHLIPFHIIRHLLGSHCHVMTISEGREWTFQLRFLFLMSHKYIHTLEITFLPLY